MDPADTPEIRAYAVEGVRNASISSPDDTLSRPRYKVA
jgi:hypothetical protein